jgi:pSer/pThr/pTyr-binding forkhead associated (FHA) protein
LWTERPAAESGRAHVEEVRYEEVPHEALGSGIGRPVAWRRGASRLLDHRPREDPVNRPEQHDSRGDGREDDAARDLAATGELDETGGLDDTVLVPRTRASRVPDDDTIVRPRGATAISTTGTAPAPGAAPALPVRRVHAVRVGVGTHRLDAPLVIGRRPAAPRVVSGSAVVLVAVPSPTGEVSSSHVRVEQVGATVVVTDLRSTNGTVVTMPGRLPVTLRQGESSVALAGTIVDVGDGNLLEILPPPRPAAQEEPRP